MGAAKGMGRENESSRYTCAITKGITKDPRESVSHFLCQVSPQSLIKEEKAMANVGSFAQVLAQWRLYMCHMVLLMVYQLPGGWSSIQPASMTWLAPIKV